MYCGQCGKRVLDTMLYCPFCGAPIVIPDQEASQEASPGDLAPDARRVAQSREDSARAQSVESRPRHARRASKTAAPRLEEGAPTDVRGGGFAEPAPDGAPFDSPFADIDFRRTAPSDKTEASEALDRAVEAFKPLRRDEETSNAPVEDSGHAGKTFEPLRWDEETSDAPVEDSDHEVEALEPLRWDEETSNAPVEDSDHEVEAFEPLRWDEGTSDRPNVPDASEAETAKPEAARTAGERPRSLFDEPLSTDGAAARPERDAPGIDPPRPVRRAGAPGAPLPRSPARLGKPEVQHAKRSYIPVRDVDVDDMFMDGSRPGEDDDYDAYDRDGDFGDDYDFDESRPESFFARHIRGMVGLVLTMMLVVIALIWAVLPGGQRTLATMNLAWKANVYDDLGHEAYEAGSYARAAAYFERALARDGDNYKYAHSAMVAYSEADEDEAALRMMKRCIEMDPDNPEPYRELLLLYPDASTRPWDVSELIRMGYERTGDAALNVSGE